MRQIEEHYRSLGIFLNYDNRNILPNLVHFARVFVLNRSIPALFDQSSNIILTTSCNIVHYK